MTDPLAEEFNMMKAAAIKKIAKFSNKTEAEVQEQLTALVDKIKTRLDDHPSDKLD